MFFSIVPLAAGVVLSSPFMLLAAAYGRREHRLLLPVPLIINVLLLYAAVAAGYAGQGVWLIAGADLLLCLAAVPGICRDPRGFCRRFFNPVQVIFLLWITVFFFYNRGRLFYHWDEFSHWGLAVRVMADTRMLPCFSAESLQFASYPPGTTLWQWLFCALSGGFAEEIPVFATVVMLFAFLAAGAAGFTWNDRGEVMLYALTGWMIPAAFLAFFYSVYADGVLAMLSGYAVVLIVLRERGERNTVLRWAALILTGAFAVLIKSSGRGLSVLIYMIMLAEVLCRRESWRERLRREVPGLVIYPAAVWLFSQSWQYFLRTAGTPEVFSTTAIDAASLLRAFFLNEPGHSWAVAAAWGRRFLPGLSVAGELWTYTPGVLAIMIWLTAVFLYLRRSVPEDLQLRRRLTVAAWAAPAAVQVFAVTLLVWYIFSFPLREALATASFDRYVNTVLLAFYFAAVVIAGFLRRPGTVLPEVCFYIPAAAVLVFMIPFRQIAGKSMLILAAAVICAAVMAAVIYFYRRGGGIRKSLFVLLVLLPLLRFPWLGMNLYHTFSGFSYWKRGKLAPAAAVLHDGLRAGKNKVMMIHQGGTGEYYHMMRFMAYPAVKQSPWSFRLPGSAPDVWSVAATPQEVLSLLPEGGYLYCHYADEKFRRDYGTLFGDPVINGGIYSAGKDGKLRLCGGGRDISGPVRP